VLLITSRVPSLLDGQEVGPVSTSVSSTSGTDLRSGDTGNGSLESHEVFDSLKVEWNRRI
jgi:hypothetical protein